MAVSVVPQEEINILLLGETGAGKSTFINAFANYFKFNSLDDAISGELEVLISCKFTITDDDYEMKTISIVNEDDDNEDEDKNDVLDSVGESSTQECGAYVFHANENKIIRLIDTPGIGDTRGIEYDKKNFENTLKCINQYDYLNGICILLKPNNARLNIIFKYCIQELLSHLHKSAKDNIVFCFTNTRGTFFRPGDTLPVLKEQLNEIQKNSDIEIKICKDTIYSFDNESFRFLAAVKEGMAFTDKEIFAVSWEKSSDESMRLLQYIINCTPHKLIDTISLNNARQIVTILYEPLAEVNRNIQENLFHIKKLKKDIQRSDITVEELKSKLYIPDIKLELKLLDRPKVVCTSSNCQKSDKTVESCHIKWKKLNAFIQKRNGVMIFGKCKSCGCPAKKHKAIFSECKSNYLKKFDKNIKNKISENKLDQFDKQDHINMLQEKIDQLIVQKDTIDNIVIQFTQFLTRNAIATFNDKYAEYLDYIICLEKKNLEITKSCNNEILEGLEETKRKYDEKVKVINKEIESGEPSSCSPSIEDIFYLVQQLYNLPNIGQYLQDVNQEEKETLKYREKHFKISKNQNIKLSKVLNTLTKIFKNAVQ
ncbi:p-loop containing nucleoside triphosphate hydrolase [Gigaspora margarita]|uniref:p-loop containing nucleoside triphosphate hydrolase n=2 Tax=Gigaspora margarita TaxID=4874 RepID=A0A8H4AL55_GIGMA|nr:p-loop containing nucleoside triphosphate hydrolase [Gigaspora margarita]